MNKKVKLGDVCDMSIGFVGTVTTQYEEGGILFFRTLNIKPYKIDTSDVKRITKEFHEKQKKSQLMAGDIAMVHTGVPGICCVIPEEYNNSNCIDMIVIKPKKGLLNAYYLEAYMNTVGYKHIENQQVGCVQKHFNLKDAIELEIFLPSIKVQNSIGELVKVINHKMENNNKINSELEAMAKTIYDYWFLQFEFPNEEGKPYKSSGGKMVWSEELKREIPEGWIVKSLNNCISRIIDHRGLTPKKLGGDWAQSGIIALSAKNVKSEKLVNIKDANKVNNEMYEKWMPEKLEDGDILMTSEAPLGEFYYILMNTEYCLSQRLFAIRADKNQLQASYLYYELSRGHGYSQIIGSQSGSTVFGIRQDELKKVNILIPNKEIQNQFNEIVMPILLKIRSNDKLNVELVELRDYLLPLLINGQVGFKDNISDEISYKELEERTLDSIL